MDFNTMVDKLGDAIARDDYRNARKIVNAVDDYLTPADFYKVGARLEEYNDYANHVAARYSH